VERKKYESYVETVWENRQEGTGWNKAVMKKLKEEAEVEEPGTACPRMSCQEGKNNKATLTTEGQVCIWREGRGR